MADEFSGTTDTSTAPARNLSPVTPHATNALDDVSKALYVGGAGNLVVRAVDDTVDVTMFAVPAGSIIPVRVSHVRATTTATDIVALF